MLYQYICILGGMMSIFLMGCYDSDADKWLTVTKVSASKDKI